MSFGNELPIAFPPTSTEGNPLNVSIFLAGCSILFLWRHLDQDGFYSVVKSLNFSILAAEQFVYSDLRTAAICRLCDKAV